MTAYYNEIDPYAAQWLRNLIDKGLIAPGDVDERDIRNVRPSDLTGYTQCHFFAGIAGWSYALRLAGWPDDRPVWTGSCPCQPFSQAGKRAGTADERHLWPAWFHLIEQCHPPVVFGEQVASRDGLSWLDLVCSDLEGASYAVGAIDLCAASVEAPHIRQRLWFVAQSESEREQPGITRGDHCEGKLLVRPKQRSNRSYNGETNIVANAVPTGWPEGRSESGDEQTTRRSESGQLEYADISSQYERTSGGEQPVCNERHSGSFWSELDWLLCRDGKARPIKPGLQPLAHGVPARMAKLRAAGNAIVPPLAVVFIKAYLQTKANAPS